MTIIRRDPGSLHCPPVDPDKELIHVDCASHTYPDGSVGIHEMCFSVLKHEIVALCGPNGSGKSTLIEHLNGLLMPSRGDIWVSGRSITRGEQSDLWKEVGIVFQRSDDQLFAPTVLDDVMFGPLNLGMSPETAREAAMEALTAVGAANLVAKLPNYLSGGQKRLVSIAGILAMRPRIIALDEPTSDLDLAARIADRVCLVKNGSIFAEGRPDEIFYNAALIQEAGLRLPDTVRTWLEFCEKQGIVSADRPITREHLVSLLHRTLH
jgi:cobalt/nickel transport system ATP-binding protein